jgi:hypothetical protein
MANSIHVVDLFTARIGNRIAAFLDAERNAADKAAKAAQRASRAQWNRRRDKRPRVPGREGRPETIGIGKGIVWKVTSTGAAFDYRLADKKIRHWFIHEIGTGKSAKMIRRGPNGRIETIRKVKQQHGRRISIMLIWSDNGGKSLSHGDVPWCRIIQTSSGGKRHVAKGRRRRPATGRGQLILRSTPIMPRESRIRIRHEIKGKHFVQHGAQTGFRSYKKDLMTAGRRHWEKDS